MSLTAALVLAKVYDFNVSHMNSFCCSIFKNLSICFSNTIDSGWPQHGLALQLTLDSGWPQHGLDSGWPQPGVYSTIGCSWSQCKNWKIQVNKLIWKGMISDVCGKDSHACLIEGYIGGVSVKLWTEDELFRFTLVWTFLCDDRVGFRATYAHTMIVQWDGGGRGRKCVDTKIVHTYTLYKHALL